MLSDGRTEDELFSFLQDARRSDLDPRYILSSMCTLPHPVAQRAHELFLETNLGDPGLFPGTARLERLLIERIGALFHLPSAGGYATSGGTESNLQALRLARDQRREIRSPNVIVPESAHFSFRKACDILNLEMRTVNMDSSRRMDASDASAKIDASTICIVGIAGTTEYGMVDPIRTLSQIAEENRIFFHVDAAFGGMVIPFHENPVPFDFSLPGVTTIAVDPHKMGLSTIPCGCLLTRDPDLLSILNVDTPYLTVKQEFTLAGTRPGAPVAAALAVLDYLGISGMRSIVRGCMKNTHRLIDGMETLGILRAATPDVNVATFACTKVPDRWKVSWTRQGHLRLVCMPHVHGEQIEEFLSDIGEIHA